MEDRIILIGGKGTAVNIAEQIEDARVRYGLNIAVHGFAIDDETLGPQIAGFPVVCKIRDLATRFTEKPFRLIFCLYRTDVMRERTELLDSYHLPSWRFATFIHPSAFVASSAQVGVGSVVLSHTSVHHNVSIGSFNIINSNVVIEHDTVFGDNNFVSASACIGSRVHVGNGCFIGLNASVREGVAVDDFALLGMGSNVLRSVGLNQVHFGNPARQRR